MKHLPEQATGNGRGAFGAPAALCGRQERLNYGAADGQGYWRGLLGV